MWRSARVVRRGLKSGGSGVENRAGWRNAVVQTLDGKQWHTIDKTYCRPFTGTGLVPSTMRDRNGPYPSVRKDQWVIIDVSGAKATHGRNPEPRHWMVASEYWPILGKHLAQYPEVSHIAQPGVIGLIKDFLRDDFGPTSRQDWLELERRKIALVRQGVRQGYIDFVISYFLLGQGLNTATSLVY